MNRALGNAMLAATSAILLLVLIVLYGYWGWELLVFLFKNYAPFTLFGIAGFIILTAAFYDAEDNKR